MYACPGTTLQAGVDLGTVVREYDDAVRTVKRGGSSSSGKAGRGGGKGSGDTKSEAARRVAQGIRIQPKRRMPVSKVRGPALPQSERLASSPSPSPSPTHLLCPATAHTLNVAPP